MKVCALKNIVFPNGLEEIEETAFSGACSSNIIAEIRIPSSVKKIGDWAFNGVDVRKVYIEGATTTIGIYAITGSPEIYGKAGSFAETYATANGYTFVAQ